MKATIPYIEKKFEEFNQQMFGGNLPKLPIELSDAKTFLGVCVFNKRKLPNGTMEYSNFRLRINTRIDLPEQEIEDTIIHEMIHYFIGYNQLEDASAHGPLFQRMMNSINEKHGRRITISHRGTKEENEQAIDKRERWHVVAVMKFKNGKTGIKVLPRVRDKIVNYYAALKEDSKTLEIDMFMAKDAYFNRFPTSGALTYHYAEREEVMPHLEGAERIKIDGQVVQTNEQKSEPKKTTPQRQSYHVIAVMALDEGKTGIKVLPRVVPSILKYYNGILELHEVHGVELYMTNDPFFGQYPNSASLIYHYVEEEELVKHLAGAEHMSCDGAKITRGKKTKK